MKIGLIGLAQTGKKTLFELITRQKPSEHDLIAGKSIAGIAEIGDLRFEWLVNLYQPKKSVRARINVDLLPNLEKGFANNSEFIRVLGTAEALCHVVRVFKDDSVYHVHGSIDPKRDIAEVNSELLLYDLMLVEKRLERIEKDMKHQKDERVAREKELLLKLKDFMEPGRPLRLFSFNPDERKIIANYQFVTLKELIIVLNVSEDALVDNALLADLEKEYASLKIYFIQVSAKVEAEIAKLEDDKERAQFLESLGIKEAVIDRLKRVCLKALNLISFFTVGKDEVRQWTIRAGQFAPVAAGAIHTDLEKGFIRAEVMKYNELHELGSEEKVHSAGKSYLKGKDYIVEDGDILNIRFNV
jgi:GTP-binding protein YchF